MLSPGDGGEKNKQATQCQAGRCVGRHRSLRLFRCPEPGHGRRARGGLEAGPERQHLLGKEPRLQGCISPLVHRLVSRAQRSGLLQDGGLATRKPPLQPISLAFCSRWVFSCVLLSSWKNLPCKGRLKELGLSSLEKEKAQGDLTTAFQCLKGGCRGYGGSLFTRSHGEDKGQQVQVAPGEGFF